MNVRSLLTGAPEPKTFPFTFLSQAGIIPLDGWHSAERKLYLVTTCFQIFPTVILRCVTPQKAGDSMNIGIVGAGKVGFSFGRLLAEKACGYPAITAAIPTAQEKPQNLQIPDTIPTWANSSKIVTRFFITVPDNAITEVYRQVAEFEIQDKYICHCSGACTAEEAFPGIHAQGAYAISIHLLFPISSKYNCWRELAGAFLRRG